MLSQRLAPDWPALLSCLDLLLTWTAARICEANTSALLKALSFLQDLFAHMRDQVRRPICLTHSRVTADSLLLWQGGRSSWSLIMSSRH